MATIGLAMIVKDEAANIQRCLEAARPHVDHWTIIDTGSTDGTQELIRQTLKDVPGVLSQRRWRNFGHNRTELMQAAKGTADYLLLLDADMVLHMPDNPDLTADCYHGRILGSSIDYTLPLLVRGDRNWTYEGVAHSYLASDSSYTEQELSDLAVEDYSSTGPQKLRRDLELLSAEHARDPLGARTAFYLAQTYKDLDMIPEAIAAYRYRANLNGWDEETFYARYMLGTLLCEHVSASAGIRELLKAWEFRPSRIEPLRVISNVANSVADKTPYPADRLFVHRAKYTNPPTRIPAPMPPLPSLKPARRKAIKRLTRTDVSAVIVTRGNVTLEAILETLIFDDIVIWNNAEREHDYKVFGRYAAIPEAKNPVIYWQDDDTLVTPQVQQQLIELYEPGLFIANMDDGWRDYYDGNVALGAGGSICDANVAQEMFARYFAEYPFDDDVLLECDFIFGVLAPHKIVDLGFDVREFADAPDRLYHAPGQTERKFSIVNRALELKARVGVA